MIPLRSVERLPNSVKTESGASQGRAQVASAESSKRNTHPFIECTCARCNMKFSSKTQLNLHLTFDHDYLKTIMNGKNGGFECLECRKVFVSPRALKLHLYNESLTCSYCGETFEIHYHLRKHLKKNHSAPKTLECQICSRIFPSQAAMSIHYHYHGNRNFTCEVCGRKFYTKRNLDSHVELLHTYRWPMPSVVSTHTQMYHCAICCRPFGLNHNRLVHHLCAHYQRPLECPACDQVLNGERQLGIHLHKHHSSTEDHICHVCQKQLSTHKGLMMHRRFHGKPQISCPDCNEKFHSKGILKQHQRIAHTVHSIPLQHNLLGKDKFGCAICYKRFLKRYGLIQHLTVHYPPTIPCPKCHLRYRTDVRLRRHTRSNCC